MVVHLERKTDGERGKRERKREREREKERKRKGEAVKYRET